MVRVHSAGPACHPVASLQQEPQFFQPLVCVAWTGPCSILFNTPATPLQGSRASCKLVLSVTYSSFPMIPRGSLQHTYAMLKSLWWLLITREIPGRLHGGTTSVQMICISGGQAAARRQIALFLTSSAPWFFSCQNTSHDLLHWFPAFSALFFPYWGTPLIQALSFLQEVILYLVPLQSWGNIFPFIHLFCLVLLMCPCITLKYIFV